MTTFAALQDAERELEARTAAAWAAYSDELRALAVPSSAMASPGAGLGLLPAVREGQEPRAGRAASGGSAEGAA